MAIAFTMHRDERIAVASYLGTNAPVAAPPASAFCADRTVKLAEKPNPPGMDGVPAPATLAFNPLKSPD